MYSVLTIHYQAIIIFLYSSLKYFQGMFLKIKPDSDFSEFSYLSGKPGQSLRSAQFDSSGIVFQGQIKKNVNIFNNL